MDATEVRITLLGGFDLTYFGRGAALPLGAQRLLAFLSLQTGVGLHRAMVAERLWPDSSPDRAAANLRSALWRGRRIGNTSIVECMGHRLRLSPTVTVDLHDLQHQSGQICSGRCNQLIESRQRLVDALSRELLPAWIEDWLVLERQRWDQRRLHTLEVMAEQFLAEGLHFAALQTALTAIEIEPIRETAHRIVVEVYVAEGNGGCALRHFQRYRALLQNELGVAPSAKMIAMASSLMPS